MSHVECVVLGLLHEGFRYGYELNKALDERNMRYWNNLSRKAIYLALQRMTEKGWIEASEYKQDNMPAQTRYSLTDEGKTKLVEMIAEGLASQEFVKFGYSIPMAFIYILSSSKAIEQILKRRDWVVKFIEQIPSQELDNDSNIALGKRANIRLLRSYYQMELEWIDWVLLELKKEKDD